MGERSFMGGNALIVIGLTDGIVPQETIIASLFRRRLCPHRCRQAGAQTLQEARESLAVTFGREILARMGRSIARNGCDGLLRCTPVASAEEIVHPHMVRSACDGGHQRAIGAHAVVLNAALLHRMKLDEWCEAVCFVSAPKWLRLLRAIKRDGATVSSFLRVERSQRDIRVGMIEGARTVHIVENWGPAPFIHRQVQEFCATMGI